MGQIVANNPKRPVKEVINIYGDHLALAVSKITRYRANINVLQHGMGYFSKNLTTREKKYFLIPFNNTSRKRYR